MPGWSRLAVLTRDGYRCTLQLPGVCSTRATCVHHVLGRAVTGDNPTHLTSACQPCNAATGDPSAADPTPAGRTHW
jgi:5-methylcytosine-specific restriction endonuclease McrA